MRNAVKEEQAKRAGAPVTGGYNSQLQTGQYRDANKRKMGNWRCHEAQNISPKFMADFRPYVQENMNLSCDIIS